MIRERKSSPPQKCKSLGPVKNILFQHFITTFYNFILTIETEWTKKVVKPIPETRNANDVSMYVWFIHSRIKNLKNVLREKE